MHKPAAEKIRKRNPARIPPQTPFCGREISRGKARNPFPQKNSFGKTESALKPHALPEYLEGRTPKEKHPFLFQKKSGARKIKNARSVFSFGVAGVLASAWGFLRIICFGNRFELGTINTPIFKIRILGDCCPCLAGRQVAPPKAGLGRSKDFIRIFEIQKQFLPAQTKVRTNFF